MKLGNYNHRIYWQKGSLRKCDFTSLTVDDQIELMNATVKSQWNGPTSYDLKFIKKVLQDVEEVYEEWYTIYAEKLNSIDHGNIIYRHYCYPMSDDVPCITIMENTENIIFGQTGFRTWGASLEAVSYFSRHNVWIKGKLVGEIGAGCGLLGLFLKLIGAERVVMSDVQELIERLQLNVRINTNVDADVISLDWETFHSLPEKFKDLNVLVAADVIYDPILIPHLVRVIKEFLSDKEKYCLISQTIRQESTLDIFKCCCSKERILMELLHEKVPGNSGYFDFSEEMSPIHIYRLYSQDAIPRQTTISSSKDKSG